MSDVRILVVDSDEVHAARCRAVLEDAGYGAVVASDAKAALASLRACGAVVADPVLVDGRGGEVLAAARAAGTPAFEMSDLFVGATNRDIAIALDGCADAFAKPLDGAALLPWLERLFGRPQPAPVASPARDGWAGEPTSVSSAPGRVDETPTPPTAIDPRSMVSIAPTAAPSQLAMATRPVGPVAGGPAPAGVGALPPALDAAAVGARGTLAVSSFAAVFASAMRAGFSGTLDIWRDGERCAVSFASGRVVGARSDAPECGLAAVLISDGLLREDQRDAIARNLGPAALEDVATYVDAGLIESADVGSLERVIVARRVQRPFGWVSGEFAFVAGVPAPTTLVTEPLELLWRCVVNEVPPGWRESALSRWVGRAPLWRVPPPTRDQLMLMQWERGFVGSIDGSVSLGSLLESARDAERALALVYALVAAGYLAFGG
ncbi:MAG: DUF4388 domain-containing protein [Myxococcales bacterium]|nr:DUF4388 domain-containing protein [Myxococcales bacterium]MCB9530686.1 DUF4388 domain-containing protein [Myxococcales bacterium]MCB9533607.1 DUF4388 domain-containing protein [Myxococcales bacterium]